MYFVFSKKEKSPGVGFHGDGIRRGTSLPPWQIGSPERIEEKNNSSEEDPPFKAMENKIPDDPLW